MYFHLTDKEYVVETEDLKDLLREINEEVNAFEYETDTKTHQKLDFWTSHLERYEKGDCDDYALTKRRLLIERGVPWQALQPMVCTLKGEGHLVLLVRTNKRDLILDNRDPIIREWDKIRGYEWIARLAGTRGWVKL